MGLLAGLLLPDLALSLRPWLPELIALLIFVSAFRIGSRAALGSVSELPRTLGLIAVYQLVLPLAALGALAALGLASTPVALALVLMMSAPSVTGSPNFAILMGRDPAPALRLLILGTALFPLTSLPILIFHPLLSDVSVLAAATRLLITIAVATSVAFFVRGLLAPELSDTARDATDGASAILLAIVVIGLMSAIGPTLSTAPKEVGYWLFVVLCANLGLQIAAFAVFRNRPGATARSIVAGNRNIALYLIALPPEVSSNLLVFIGCYQVPMYLTPILMAPLYRRGVKD